MSDGQDFQGVRLTKSNQNSNCFDHLDIPKSIEYDSKTIYETTVEKFLEEARKKSETIDAKIIKPENCSIANNGNKSYEIDLSDKTIDNKNESFKAFFDAKTGHLQSLTYSLENKFQNEYYNVETGALQKIIHFLPTANDSKHHKHAKNSRDFSEVAAFYDDQGKMIAQAGLSTTHDKYDKHHKPDPLDTHDYQDAITVLKYDQEGNITGSTYLKLAKGIKGTALLSEAENLSALQEKLGNN